MLPLVYLSLYTSLQHFSKSQGVCRYINESWRQTVINMETEISVCAPEVFVTFD